jgi:hypothetical protein
MICSACQNDILVKESYLKIKCVSCNAIWYNNAKSNCPDCEFGKGLTQKYPNVIYCMRCNSKWSNAYLSQFGKSQRGYYASKYKASRG